MSEDQTDGRPTEDIITPDSDLFRRVMGQFATGVTVITAMEGGEPIGVAANSFTSVSLDPPLVLFCVAHTSTTWPRLQLAKSFAINILGDHQEEVCRIFATRGADRFAQVPWHLSAAGSPVLRDVLAYIDCVPWQQYEGGDHVIVVGRVLDVAVTHDAGPLVFFQGRYGRLAAE